MADIKDTIDNVERCLCHIQDACMLCPHIEGDATEDCMENLMRDALEAMKFQQTEIERLRQPKWTYANEGMPKYECYGKKYWVYTQYRKSSGEVSGRKVELLRWEQTTIRGKTVERFKTLWDAVVYDEVIAWMPLKEPEPPMMD